MRRPPIPIPALCAGLSWDWKCVAAEAAATQEFGAAAFAAALAIPRRNPARGARGATLRERAFARSKCPNSSARVAGKVPA